MYNTDLIPWCPLVALPECDLSRDIAPIAAALREAFGVSFSFWEGETGDLTYVSRQQPSSNDPTRGELCRAVMGDKPQFIADEDSVLVLAVPFQPHAGLTVVGTAAFVCRPLTPGESLANPARLLGLSVDQAQDWIGKQTIWPADVLVRLATAVQKQVRAEARVAKLGMEVDKLSDNLASTYEEICLLHGVTQNLRISRDDEELSKQVLEWLLDCLPAESLAIQLQPVADDGECTYKARTRTVLIGSGRPLLDDEAFSRLAKHLELDQPGSPVVVNDPLTSRSDWPFPEIRQLIVVPMSEGGRVYGWLAAMNHCEGKEFGTVEASLLNSVGAMVGIHTGNRDLYRQQSEFLASVVRALTSAIDAKDPYTCGHSDRVARVAVRLAKELNCSPDILHVLYMAGLLHDIGKIGIDDTILRKPGKLTDVEMDHIKLHPELGYRILADIRQLRSVLPAVLHHHEQWDGRGYPHRLQGEKIPYIARIVAVADAFDAMSSDRPYRKGMDAAKVDAIFRAGAAHQWDPAVVAAFFRAREEINSISSSERANLTLDVQQWL